MTRQQQRELIARAHRIQRAADWVMLYIAAFGAGYVALACAPAVLGQAVLP